MKRLFSLLAAALMMVLLAVPAFAANEFVPSIGYKDGPEIDEAEMNQEDVTACLVVTSLLQAQDKKTDISQEDRDLLLEVYEKLKANKMELPLESEDLVIRELIDVSWREEDCQEPGHPHKEWLQQENTALTVTFKTNIPSDVEVVVLVYVNSEWVRVESVTQNSDNTLTCVFEDICPVAICVPSDANEPPAVTGDDMGRMLWLWVLLLVCSVIALTTLFLSRRKFLR